MERVYSQPNNGGGQNAHSIAVQNQILDMCGTMPDARIARELGVGSTTVSSLRRRNKIPAFNYQSSYQEINVMPVRRNVVVERLTGRYDIKKVAKRNNVSFQQVNAWARKFMPLSGLPKKHRGNGYKTPARFCITKADAEHLYDDILLCRWGRSDELRRHIFFYKKWKYVRRLCFG